MPTLIDIENFPSKLYANENNEVLVYVKELSKMKHYIASIEKWKIHDNSEEDILRFNQSVVVWEVFQLLSSQSTRSGFWVFSSIVQEG